LYALAVRTLVMLADVLGILNVLQALMKQVAQEHIAFQIESTVVATSLNVGSPTFGLSALHTQLAAAAAQDVIDHAALVALIAGAQQAINPVILPTIPPTGYGGGTGASAADVWAYTLPGSGIAAADQQDNAGYFAIAMGIVRALLPLQSEPMFATGGTWWSGNAPSGYGSQPIFPIANILATDTLLVFLDRESYYSGWALNPGGTAWIYDNDPADDYKYVTAITALGFLTLRESLFPTAVGVGAPLWPGLADVTLGTPVALTAALDVAVVMHGAIITLTAVPPGKPTYTLGTAIATAHIGQITFVNDNGDLEYPQNLSFASEVYVPLTMVKASGAKLRCVPGVTGTITPWTINP
jgi:hypothetical protein